MNDNTSGNVVIPISVGAGILETFAVILRLPARRRGNVDLATDDLWLFGSLLPTYLMMVCCGISASLASFNCFLALLKTAVVTKGGAGKPADSLGISQTVVLLKAMG